MLIRCLALLASLLLTFVTVSASAFAAADDPLGFTMDAKGPDRVQLRLDRDTGRHDRNFSTGYFFRDLSGLSPAALLAPAPAALNFALIAPAGRIDCAGSGKRGHAEGRCNFRHNLGFAATLGRHGYAPPGFDDGLALTALRFDPEVLDALDAARFQRGKTGDLAALAIFNIHGREVRAFTAAGYRPASVDALVQMKVLGVTPEFVARFVRAGYPNLTADQLVRLKIFDVSPELVRSAAARNGPVLSSDELMERRLLGRGR